MPNCIHIETPPETIATVLKMYDVRDKVVYEPGCGVGRFLQFAEADHASFVYGCEMNPDLATVTRKRLAGKRHIISERDMLHFIPLRNVDLVYCYLMHGLTERLIKHLIAHNHDNFTVISHNYPVWLGLGTMYSEGFRPVEELFHGLDKYPPYSLLYRYEVKNGKIEAV